MRGDGGHHLAPAQPVLADILVVDHQVEQQPLRLGQALDHPGGQAVGVYRQAQGGKAGGKRGQVLGQLVFQKRDVVVMADQAQTGLGRPGGLAAADQQGARRFLQRLDALADRRGRDIQVGRRQVERAAPVHGGKGCKLGRV